MSRTHGSLTSRLLSQLLGLWLSPVKVNTPVALGSVNRILILRNDALGDAVVTTPLWHILKRTKPGIRIGVVASKANAELLQADPDIDEVFVLENKLLTDLAVARRIRRTHWDHTFCLKYNNKTSSAFQARRFAPGSVTSTVAFNDDPRYERMFSVVSRQRRSDGDHMTEVIRKHLQTVIDIRVTDWHPTITIPARHLAYVNDLLEPLRSYAGFVHLNLHASLPIREWSLSNVIDFCSAFRSAHPDMGIVVTGHPDRIIADGAKVAQESIPGVLVLPPLTQLDLCAVVRESTLVLTPDTSLTHIASAERKPVVTLHYRKNEWFPYGVPHAIIYSRDEQSVHDIPVREVLARVEALLHERNLIA